MIEAKYRMREPMEILKLKRNTVIITCGPSECGKSHFAKRLQSVLNSQGFTCSIISSDDCRRELLLSPEEHKHSPKMMPISGPAFDLAYNKLKGYTTYPVNHDFIIFDSTALNSYSRKRIAAIAKENKYSVKIVSFDYNDESEYYKYTDADWLVDQHLKAFKKEKPNDYRITRREMPTVEVIDESRNTTVEGELIVIADVHGCYDQLIQLLNKLDALQNDADGNIEIDPFKNVIFVGDLVDKGPNSEKVVDFLMPQVIAGNCKVIRGNHENYLIKRWAGEITNDNGLQYFDSHSIGGNFREKLKEIWLRSYSYIRGDNCIITHSPTPLVNLGKSSQSKEMRNFRHSRFTKEELYEQLGRMAKPRNKYMDLHIFGHIEFPNVYENKGMIGIDTGCVSGGKLTAIKVSGHEFKTVHVPGHKE